MLVPAMSRLDIDSRSKFIVNKPTIKGFAMCKKVNKTIKIMKDYKGLLGDCRSVSDG